ncbi:hypothetical protein pdam_00013615 [Pocillopora damicornis]|uniref:Uncharacterized protein n=1 Tax=Pocillopora damicornis TaxID=46731 RepID=A0A3M6U2G8_POCDA|nr:hypothetical protein pdam_00013615 [Pocillopora damicornis]
METSPMAGKSWQPSRESSHRKGKQTPITLNKQWKEGGKGYEYMHKNPSVSFANHDQYINKRPIDKYTTRQEI